ncbi:electron transport complex subunit RsxB [Paracidovorax valerianellae]|uniref:Electron transport complex protein RnfB n=1 Tax=Paracidovorax valerianellae TaxID=187868 RepID=A0A1G7DQK1_9BURK|nr:electron transport complex subunit RsxB [Paracidovorax valerianellae]MDA8446695.1 electron transport complex subunit RsxB [Paracidovorax valerianellae]SDE53749.1 electron transport complex protein RnfB [Paracidovorax valerianellae]
MTPAADAVRALAARIDAALPQTQCTRCGYPDCAAYALAVATGEAGINQCPPGGAEGVERLAALTHRPVLPLSPEHGTEGPRAVAFIDESWCIGCTLCLKACPTDAIFGANKLMHTVIEAHCTGCELCIPVCPVDCIVLENASGSATGWQAWSPEQAEHARSRYAARTERFARMAKPVDGDTDRTPAVASTAANLATGEAAAATPSTDAKQAAIAAALARARARRAPPGNPG